MSGRWCFAQWFNRRHRRVGHLFQGRYTAVSVQTDAHLRRAVRYVIRNPIRARLSISCVPRDPEFTRAMVRPPRPTLDDLMASTDDREGIVTAHIVRGYSLREIATHLGCSVTTVHRRVHACSNGGGSAPARAAGGTKKT